MRKWECGMRMETEKIRSWEDVKIGREKGKMRGWEAGELGRCEGVRI